MEPKDKDSAGPQGGPGARPLETVPPFLISVYLIYLLFLPSCLQVHMMGIWGSTLSEFSFDGSGHLERDWSFSPTSSFPSNFKCPGKELNGQSSVMYPSCAKLHGARRGGDHIAHLWPFQLWPHGWGVLPGKMEEFSWNQGVGHKTQGLWHITISQPSLNWGFFIQQSYVSIWRTSNSKVFNT